MTMSEQSKGVTRRLFVKGTVSGIAGAGATQGCVQNARGADSKYPASQSAPVEFDFTQGSGALGSDKVIDSACQFCNSLCRLKVHVRAGRVIDITGETDDPVQAGGICDKGPMMTQLLYNPLRLTSPMKRVGGEKGSADSIFEAISWDEALGI